MLNGGSLIRQGYGFNYIELGIVSDSLVKTVAYNGSTMDHIMVYTSPTRRRLRSPKWNMLRNRESKPPI